MQVQNHGPRIAPGCLETPQVHVFFEPRLSYEKSEEESGKSRPELLHEQLCFPWLACLRLWSHVDEIEQAWPNQMGHCGETGYVYERV